MTEEQYWSKRFTEEQKLLQKYYKDLKDARLKPSAIYEPRLFLDGNEWCALYGNNIQEGIVGFGETPALAFDDFDRNWIKRIK